MEEDAVHGDSRLKTCVVLGGRGFIGRSLVSRLLRLGSWTVRVANSAHSLHLDESDSVLEHALSSGLASYHCVDIHDKPQIVKVADILLWRNEKKTFVYFLFLNLLYYWFVFSGNTFTSSAAQLVFLSAVALYGLSFVPTKIFGFQVKKIPPWRFEMSESTVRDLSRDIVVVWNHGVRSLNP